MFQQQSDDKHLELAGQLVTLKTFVDSNITPEYIAWLRSPNLLKYSNQRFHSHSIESCKEYLSSFKGTDNLFFAIYLGAEYIGTITAYVSKVHETANIGIMIGSKNQGKGSGTDAWVTLMTHLFRAGARKVHGGTLRCNSAMIKIMLKSGMTPDGVRAAHEVVDGKPEDILHFAKFCI